MTSKHFCLKWTKFQTNILSAFESLQNTQDLADVTLTCEGIGIKAHKFILSACSPYFRTIFKENPCSHPIVILKDVSHVDLMGIINFMYHGEVTVSEDQLSSFLHTAMVLQVSGLMNTGDTPQKQIVPSIIPKKFKATNTESPESPVKKVKVSPPKPKKTYLPFIAATEDSSSETQHASPSHFEVVEVDQIKTEDDSDLGNNNDIDISENIEVIVSEKETQSSILEAALEIRDKPSSILERSLTSQAGKSPSSMPLQGEKISMLPDVPKPLFIPRKPPDEQERRIQQSDTTTFEYSSEFLQPRVKTEDQSENVEVLSPEEMSFATRSIDLQPHHNSQCGNCPHCGKVYSNQSALKYHVRLVHSDLTNMYCCYLCPESFDYREGFKKHMAEVHLIRN